MNKKVEELIERVRLTDEEIPYEADGYNDEVYDDIGERDKAIFIEGAQVQLNKVLNDPDLALILEIPAKGVSDAVYLPVIPLAEALRQLEQQPPL